MRSAIVALTLVGPWLWAGSIHAAEEPKKPAKEKVIGEAAPQEDLDRIQGRWARTERTGLFGSRRITKEMKGEDETVTYYDSKGNVERAHTAKIKLRRAGPIKVFVFTDYEVVAGPDTGYTADWTRAYVYKVVDDTFVEIWGVLEDSDRELEVLRWTRQETGEATAPAKQTGQE